ncbi:filament-like plant protein 4 [Nicotiana tomentosiformis]|uniref:filament-like plant protein 4 n=1 Tax=Nicotiana tomentosiformis TaxID=4098 RepID=UPI00051B863D|nr:filament-like plant protein 4 [Nicotiana tomentosiformis]XP_009590332.1 filament-like plant protein 4 [Nicotiana tomentosiformis]XP_009590333.1 filament-like plant protein 4 [Nicotiana tomentosiformis]
MDRRSWPWKKKSSDKAAVEKAAAVALALASDPSDSTESQGDQSKQDNHKKPKYVQISVESYSHLTGLEDQVKSFEEQVNTLEDEITELNDKLSAAQSEMTNKENLVKQHAKVAEEAVSGWEKAEAEASTLKNHLESVTLLKLTAEDRASHLDGALKECMRQIRNLKEEHEQKLHDVVLNKTKQFDKIKHELEAKIANLDQELLRSAAENSALSRSLQERSNMLVKISEEKAQAEAEIELLKSNVESCEKEINSLKYELHIAAKEQEIRNEEKNMSVRSAEVANKQHLEGVKKIAKLEAECQRLRGLVRKKLPGPAAMAQMKLEVEGLGRDYGESRLKKFPAKPSSPQYSLPDFSFDTIQKYHKENELLTERLFAMEEETKMLKEALAKQNSELQASRSMCTQTANKLQSLEAQVRANGEHRSPPKSTVRMPTEGAFSQNASLPPSLNSMSEDGNDDNVSCAGSWATTLLSELSHIKKERTFDSPHKSECVSHMELMDDFLEMEKLANLSNDMNGAVSSPDTSNARCEIANIDTLVHVTAGNDSQLKNHNETDPSEHQAYSSEEASAPSYKPASEPSPLMKLQSRISIVLESLSKEADMQKLQEDLRQIVQEVHDSIRPQSARSIVKTTVSSETASESQLSLDDPRANVEKDIHVSQDSKSCNGTVQGISKELADAMSQIHDFVIFLGKEAEAVDGASPDGTRINEKLDEFSATYVEVVSSRLNLVNFVLDLSQVLRNASELHFNILGYKTSETEMSTSDCIDKVALPENKGLQHSGGGYSNNCARFSDSSSDPDIPHEGRLVPTSESTNTSWKCSLEEFEQLKLEKNNMALDLTKCTENLESTKSQLAETEQLLAEVKSQLISAQKSNSLAETQLKCMVESYRSLETRTEELQTEVNLLQAKIECLVNELQEEKKSHHEALARCQDLEEQFQRIESCPAADIVAKTNQEKELSAAAEKLAECQETIFLLGKQLRALRPQTDTMGSPWIERSPKRQSLSEEPTTSGMNLHDTDMDELDTATSVKTNSESPMDLYNALYSPSDSEVNNPLKSPISSKHPKHRPTKSSSSSSSGGPTPEKQSRGFSRFFSSKGKISN